LTVAYKKYFNVEYKRTQPHVHRVTPRRDQTTITQGMESKSSGLGSHSEGHWN